VNYKIIFRPVAQRELGSLSQAARIRIATKIEELSENPRPPGVRKLSGVEELYRVRVGDFRIVYAIDDDAQTVRVVAIGDRSEIYRRGLR
jgi:mRNA interferase RelE/StbE